MKVQLLSIDDLTKSDVSRLFFALRSTKRKQVFENCPVMMTCFLEPSTRTRLSFEMAASRLGIKTINFDASSSSMKKGESWRETLLTLDALGPDVIITRTPFQLEAELVSQLKASLINGGDGTNEHPTQALLDAFTLLEHFGGDDLNGKRIVILGDTAHSRVAHSNIKLLLRLKAHISLLSPPSLSMKHPDCEMLSDFGELRGPIDAVMVLRIQKERLMGVCEMSDEEYFSRYGLSRKRFDALGAHCVLLHPGPMNAGVEIDASLREHPRSLIVQQVENGVLMRMKLIEQCLSTGEL